MQKLAPASTLQRKRPEGVIGSCAGNSGDITSCRISWRSLPCSMTTSLRQLFHHRMTRDGTPGTHGSRSPADGEYPCSQKKTGPRPFGITAGHPGGSGTGTTRNPLHRAGQLTRYSRKILPKIDPPQLVQNQRGCYSLRGEARTVGSGIVAICVGEVAAGEYAVALH